jgi:hypothetical protein
MVVVNLVYTWTAAEKWRSINAMSLDLAPLATKKERTLEKSFKIWIISRRPVRNLLPSAFQLKKSDNKTRSFGK